MSTTNNLSREASHTTIRAEDIAQELAVPGESGPEAAAIELGALSAGFGVVLPAVEDQGTLPPELGRALDDGQERHSSFLFCDTCVIIACALFMMSVVGLCTALVIWLFLDGLSNLEY